MIWLLKCVQELINGSGFPSLSCGIPPIIDQIRFKENRDSNKSFDPSSIKPVNNGGPFSFPTDYGDISSFEPEWDCSTDLHIAASLGKSVDTLALG